MEYIYQNDEYLIALSNKGTLKRANKDLEGIIDNIELTENTDDFCLEFEDVKVTIKPVISESTCTCPSRTTCKHIIMSCIYLNTKLNSIKVEENKEFDDTELLTMDKNKLFKSCGSAYQKKFLLEISNDIIPRIEKTSIITISFDNVKVKILNPFENTVCSCGSSEMCNHKALSSLYYLYSIGKIPLDYFKIDDEINKKSYDKIQGYINEIKKLIEDILLLGISRATNDTLEKISQQAVYCYNYKLYNLSRGLTEICKVFNEFLNNSNDFSESILLNKLSKAYLLTLQIQNVKNYADYVAYVGVLKENFNDSNNLILIPLASEKSPLEESVTYYLVEQDEKLIYSYTHITSNSLNFRLWNTSINNIVKYKFELVSPKTNKNNQITNSTQTTVKRLDKINEVIQLPQEIINYDYISLVKLKYEHYERLVIIKVNNIINFEFDKINQTFTMQVCDENYFKIDIVTKDDKLIKILKKHCKSPTENTIFVGKIYIESANLKLTALKFYRENEYEIFT